MHNEIKCIIKIRANILQLVQLIKSFHQDGITWKSEQNLMHSLAIHYMSVCYIVENKQTEYKKGLWQWSAVLWSPHVVLSISLHCFDINQCGDCIRYTLWQDNTRLHNVSKFFFVQNPNCIKPAALWGYEQASCWTIDCQPFFWSLIQHKSHTKNISLSSEHMCHILLNKENNRNSIKNKLDTGAQRWTSRVSHSWLSPKSTNVYSCSNTDNYKPSASSVLLQYQVLSLL